MCSLLIMDLNIVVNIVNIKQILKAIVINIFSLSILELNIVVSFVNIKPV